MDGRISLCMIVRDEERFLPRCLESVRSVADEIVVVDTGSQDQSPQIARSFGARVLPYAWGDDFAAARNHGLQAATGDWILVLDADERLDPAGCAPLRDAVAEGSWEIGLLPFVNMQAGRPCGREWMACRVFRRTRGLRYVGRIHEQMVQDLPEVRTRIIRATVYHYGYDPQVFAQKEKSRRNERLIQRALVESEGLGPLVRSNYLYHYAHLVSGKELLRRHAAFAAYVRRSWPERLPQVPWVIAGLAEYARLLNDIGRYAESGRLAAELLARYGEAPLLRYLAARSLAAAGDLHGAEHELQAVLVSEPATSPDHLQYPQDVSLVQGRARFLLGLIREDQGKLEEAAWLYQAAVDEEPEEDALRTRLACVLTRLGRYPEALAALEGSATLLACPAPPVDCLGFVLAVLTRSVARLGFWGEKARQAADRFPLAATLLGRIAEQGPERNYRLTDFPEIAAGIRLSDEPGAFEMPQTARRPSTPP